MIDTLALALYLRRRTTPLRTDADDANLASWLDGDRVGLPMSSAAAIAFIERIQPGSASRLANANTDQLRGALTAVLQIAMLHDAAVAAHAARTAAPAPDAPAPHADHRAATVSPRRASLAAAEMLEKDQWKGTLRKGRADAAKRRTR